MKRDIVFGDAMQVATRTSQFLIAEQDIYLITHFLTESILLNVVTSRSLDPVPVKLVSCMNTLEPDIMSLLHVYEEDISPIMAERSDGKV